MENALFEEFKARPHWGKNNWLNQEKVQQCYYSDKLNKWKQVFQLFNKGGLFNNRFTHNMGFDSFPIDQQPTGQGTLKGKSPGNEDGQGAQPMVKPASSLTKVET